MEIGEEGEEGSPDADVRTFWCKNFGFFEIYDMLSQCGHFSDKRGVRVNFSQFCADVFYGRPLINVKISLAFSSYSLFKTSAEK